MHWWQVQFHISHEASEPVSALLQDFPDIQGVQLEGVGELQVPHPEYGEWFDEMIVPTADVLVSVYFPEDYQLGSIRDRILSVIHQVEQAGVSVGAHAHDIRIESVDDSMWLNAWKEHYEPIPVGDSLVIVPIWNRDDIPDDLKDREPIILEPGMAFGTGTHQTTHMCTKALADLDLSGTEVLDVGTGTGVLAIAAGRLGAAHVTAIDVDPVAVRAAKENIQTNALDSIIDVQEGNLLDGYAESRTFDVAVANILRDIVILLIPQVAKRLKPGGHFISSGYIDAHAPAVEEALTLHGFRLEQTYRRDDWVALRAVKR